ncbi:hypothetical protein [uncultured Psychroserpens sp.]|uniref:hypothetical protein n=1 Tax=uncultured Psychroserpens sp. TaxID=255436 RepID=UPI0026277FC9|nr:hypothetical protein [uncultured Psychroserpens sp.]
MRNLFFLLCGLFISLANYGQQENKQEVSINDFTFQNTTAPAFLLLDQTPTAIENPENIGSLATYLYSGFDSGNIAIESNLYWWFVNKENTGESYEAYRGFTENSFDQNGDIDKSTAKIDPFKGVSTNTSVSIGYIDKKFNGFAEAKKTFSIGIRSNIFSVYGEDRRTELIEAINGIRGKVSGSTEKGISDQDVLNFENAINGPNSNLTMPGINVLEGGAQAQKPYYDLAKNQGIDSKVVDYYMKERLKVMKNFYYNRKNIKPTFRADFGAGYGLLFNDNNFSSSLDRFAGWLTFDYSIDLVKSSNRDDKSKNYLHLYGIAKYVDDGFNIGENQIPFSNDYWDVGGKIEFEFKKIKFSYEYLKRSGDDDQYRSVGNFTFHYSKKLSITGGFGKDFPVDDNLVTLLGINWGINLGDEIKKLKQ